MFRLAKVLQLVKPHPLKIAWGGGKYSTPHKLVEEIVLIVIDQLDLCFHLALELTRRCLPVLNLLESIAALLYNSPQVSG